MPETKATARTHVDLFLRDKNKRSKRTKGIEIKVASKIKDKRSTKKIILYQLQQKRQKFLKN